MTLVARNDTITSMDRKINSIISTTRDYVDFSVLSNPPPKNVREAIARLAAMK